MQPKNPNVPPPVDLPTTSEFNLLVQQRGISDPAVAAGVRITTLSPSLLADLDRFCDRDGGVDLLEVVAASIRHARPLVIFLEVDGRVLPLRVYPEQGRFSCMVDFARLTPSQPIRVVRVERGLAYREAGLNDGGQALERTGSLADLSWNIATTGHRTELLPEIQGHACYRIAPTLDVEQLSTDDATARLLRRMKKHCLPLDDIVAAPGMDAALACRLLNALYLQAGLITLRASPGARTPRHAGASRQRRPAG